MAKGKDKEVKHECIYVGTHEDTALEPVEVEPIPPSEKLARTVALSVLGGRRGKYRPTHHFTKRTVERSFDVFDIEYAIHNGACVEKGEYSREHKNFKYTFRCIIDGVEFDAVVALSAEHDLINCPLLILVTGCWKTKTGLRNKIF